jgi:hypothetical protein
MHRALAEQSDFGFVRTDNSFRHRPSHLPTVALLLTMGQLNRLLTCIVTALVGYLGTYSAYVEPSGL